jgi:hypothetical protein
VFKYDGRLILIFVLLLSGLSVAKQKKEKKSATLPDFVISAQTVAVVINPGEPEPLTNPNANRNAQSDVENALTKWGRLRPVLYAQDADLVMTVRKGTRGITPTVRGGKIDDRPIILQPNGNDIRIGAQRGTPPSTTETQFPEPERPQLGTSIGNSEDLLELYQGHAEHPLDGMVIWRYQGSNGLNAPNVPAIAAFRKALEQAIQQKKQPSQTKRP